MQIFKFWPLKGGKFQFLLMKPYKECECHQNTSFKPLTTIIGPKNLKNRRLTMTISHMRRHAPFVLTDPNFCVGWGHRHNQLCKIFWKSVQEFRTGRPWKMAFPIESVHRPYNSAALLRRLWCHKVASPFSVLTLTKVKRFSKYFNWQISK